MAEENPNKFYDIRPPEDEPIEPTIGEDVDSSLSPINKEENQSQPNLDDSARRYGSDQMKQIGKGPKAAAKGAEKAAGGTAKKAGKELGKDVSKQAGKQAAKTGAKVAAGTAAGAATGGVATVAMAAADAAKIAWKKRKAIIKAFAFVVIVCVGLLMLVLTGINVRFAPKVDDACATTTDATSGNKVYVVGDSLTVGLKSQNMGNLSAKLKADQWEVLKINGVKNHNIQTALNQQVKPDKDIIKKADIVIIELGTNTDTNYQGSLNDLYTYLKSQNDSAAYFWINYTSYSPVSPSVRNRLSNQNQILKNFANNHNITVIDWAGEAKDSDYSGNDGLHPNSSGYKNMANYIVKSIGTPASANANENQAATDNEGGKTVICLDPGHVNAADNIQQGVSEKENVFAISKIVASNLEAAGYEVKLTKESADATETPDGRRLENKGGCDDEEGLKNRVKYCKAVKANYMLSVHSDISGGGPYIIVPPKPNSSCSPNTTTAYYERNKQYGDKIQDTINSVLEGKHSGGTLKAEGKDYLRCSPSKPNCSQLNVTSGAIEMNLDKAILEMTPDPKWYKNNRNLIAKAIAEGIKAAIPKNLGQNTGECAVNGGVTDLLNKACEYVKSPTKYKKDMLKSFTDCWGFVSTALKYSVDPSINRGNVGLAEYCSGEALVKRKPDLYESLGVITSTKNLQPGDILFDNWSGDNSCGDGEGHVKLYTGTNWCGCGNSNAADASLNGHGPECADWSLGSGGARVYRLKK